MTKQSPQLTAIVPWRLLRFARNDKSKGGSWPILNVHLNGYRGETLAGLVPGNPKMKTTRPSAERLLARFKNLHMIIKDTETHIEGVVSSTFCVHRWSC